MQSLEAYVQQLNIRKSTYDILRRALLFLSVLVILGVFWGLKLTGITMAGEAFCGMAEHTHDDSCNERTLICQLEEAPPHEHNDSCREMVLTCTIPEGTEPLPTEAETEAPTEAETEPITESETEAPSEAEETVPETQPVEAGEPTTEPETEPITEAETDPPAEAETEPETVSETLPEVTEPTTQPPHVHGEGCWEESFICGMEPTPGHTHSDECYETSMECDLEEHIHMASCYSNISADLENEDDWKAMMADLPLTGDPAEDLTVIAASQLDYRESTLNFQVDGQGVRRGITRYGQWYGNPYGDWSAMFVGFCLNYAGLDDLSVSAGPETMRLKWGETGMYVQAAMYHPEPGDILFLDMDESGAADSCAIVTAASDSEITMVLGDQEDAVAETTMAESDPRILGYGMIPRQPELVFQPQEGDIPIGQTVEDPGTLFEEGSQLIVYVMEGNEAYALDGYGSYDLINIDARGVMYVEGEIPERFFWEVTFTDNGMEIVNVYTGATLPDSGVQTVATMALRDDDPGQSGGIQLYAAAKNFTVWLDGTMGDVVTYRGSDNTRYTVAEGSSFQLPTTWKSPTKYNYVLQGWYDVNHGKYYSPGQSVTITGNTVFYADWVAASYDIGVYNASTVDSLDLSKFVTTHMFDYNFLFNVLSSRPAVSFNNNSHAETWELLTNGNNSYNGKKTLGFVFRDWDAGGDISYPNNSGDKNNPTNGGVYSGLYNEELADLLFGIDNGMDTGVIGKTYLGTGNFLFQQVTDPGDEYYGYYYYDSKKNAAAYNQTDERFYIYDYLVRSSDSATTDGAGQYSDFLPLNSLYANTNNKKVPTYTYQGDDNEYVGTNHYVFDAKYDASGNSTNNVSTNLWFGMRTEIKFFLPNVPGTTSNGEYGNQDIYGNDMRFQFSGDDDVWVLVDGKLILDLGGLHEIEGGDINFSTGIVTVNGVQSKTIYDMSAGDHVLTILYLERGGSQSNCAIYFNVAPRFSFSIEKEDILTKDVLNGARFSVYMDSACTVPAQLWTSAEAYQQGEPATNTFTVVNGVADMWGMGAGNSYYIKETKPPDNVDYTYAHGIIRLNIDKQGSAAYSVELIGEGTSGVSGGFTVHGFRIDDETQKAYIVATNAPKWVQETTSVQALKQWNDSRSHAGERVTVYLTVTDGDGTVRRLQEAELSDENDWRHTWENLPKFNKDGVTPIQYGVEEAYVSGYYNTVQQVTEITNTITQMVSTVSPEDGKTYLLQCSRGYLSAQNTNADTGFTWVDEATARASPLAQWTVDRDGDKVKFTNGFGHILSFYYGNGNPTDFFAANNVTEGTNVKQYFSFSASGTTGIHLYYTGNKTYYLTSNINSSNKLSPGDKLENAVVLTLWSERQTTVKETFTVPSYLITNTPLERETSVTVYKAWDYGSSTATNLHDKAQVTVRLLANGRPTGRTVTLNLKNNWQDAFQGLPYTDSNDEVIVYTVEEVWKSEDWMPFYGEIHTTPGTTPTYSTTITNVYFYGVAGPILPSTGTAARLMFVLLGGGIMLASLVYGFTTRPRRERRKRSFSDPG